MTCLSIVCMLSVLFWSVFAQDNPNDGPYFKCSQVTEEELCKSKMWCMWSTTSVCTYDKCLRWVDNETSCPTDAGYPCALVYLTDSFDCATGDPIQTDRFCRVADGQPFNRKSLSGQDCFYEDLKSIAGVATGGTRSCGNKVCAWVNNSTTGNYCDYGGSEDCTVYAQDTNEYCACLGIDYCELYPSCMKNGNTCILDPCYDADPPTTVSATEGGCTKNLVEVTTCKARREYYYNDATNQRAIRIKCFNKTKSNPNECYYATHETRTTQQSGDGTTHTPLCDKVENVESVCTGALVFDESVTPPTDGTDSCQLVDIAPGYISATKYCTDGRPVPSVTGDAASLVQVSLILKTLGLVVAMALFFF